MFECPLAGSTGGFSPGRTLGPVVGTVGLGEAGGDDFVGVVDPTDDGGGDEGGSEVFEGPSEVQPATSAAITANGTTLHKPTRRLSHAATGPAGVVHSPRPDELSTGQHDKCARRRPIVLPFLAMSGTRMRVEVEDFVAAARIMYDEVAEPVRVGHGRTCAALADLGAMAGDDPGGTDWAASYDKAARATLQATQQAVNAAFKTSSMFGRSGLNYAQAEAASTAGSQPASTSALLQKLPGDAFVGPRALPPSATGGGGDAPAGWFLIQAVVDCVWPNGHQDRLHRAADAWNASAAELENAVGHVGLPALEFAADDLPEADDIATVCRGLSDHLFDLAQAHHSLARACTDLAHHIDECHSAVEHELIELVAESVAIQAIGAVLSVVTLGLAEGPTQATQGARIAAVAAKVGVLIHRFSTAAKTLAASLPSITTAAQRIHDTLEALAGTRLAVAGAHAVGGLPRDARIARKTGEAGRQARAEIAATERLARGVTSVVKVPPKVASRKVGDPGVWKNPKSLRSHFEKHGHEFGATSPEDYATRASDLLHRGVHGEIPCKIDRAGKKIRVWDPATGAFGSYRMDGATITMFRPGNPAAYFAKQPGAFE